MPVRLRAKPLTKEDIEKHNPQIFYNFGEKFIVSDEVFDLVNQFLDICVKKAVALGKKDVRTSLLVRAQHSALKLSYLTCDEDGVVSIEGMRWAIAVVISSLRSGSFLTQDRFFTSRWKEDLQKVEDTLIRLCKKANSTILNRRDLFRALPNIGNRFMKDHLERLISNGVVTQKVISHLPGSDSILLEVTGKKLRQKLLSTTTNSVQGMTNQEKLKERLQILWQKNKGEPTTLRDLNHSLRRTISSEETQEHLQKLQKKQFLRLENVTVKGGHTSTIIHHPTSLSTKEKEHDTNAT